MNAELFRVSCSPTGSSAELFGVSFRLIICSNVMLSSGARRKIVNPSLQIVITTCHEFKSVGGNEPQKKEAALKNYF